MDLPAKKQNEKPSLKTLLTQPRNIKRIEELVGKNSAAFCSSLLQIQNNNSALQKVDANTILAAAVTAATLNLPINNTLGFAYIVPYNGQAQFQIGYKGFIQLAMRSGQIKRLACTEIYAGQIISRNPIKGYEFDFDQLPEKGESPVAYYAYMELLNGYVAEAFMTVAQVDAHAQRFSKTYHSKNSVWKEHFDAMAKKTVLKQLLTKYAPMSIEMQNAAIADQAVIREVPEGDIIHQADIVHYPDNDTPAETVQESDLNSVLDQNTPVEPVADTPVTQDKNQTQEGLLL